MNVRRAFDTFRGYRHPEFHIIQRRRRWAILSGTLITISLLALIFRGLNYSIDFTGGSLIEYRMVKPVSSEQVRVLLAQDPYDRGDAEIQIVGGDQVSISPNDISAQVVGPTWGEQISRQALIGLVVVLLAITLYITFRFEWKMAVGA